MPRTLNELEANAIEKALLENGSDLTETAKSLGVGRATLYRKIKEFNIDPSNLGKPKTTRPSEGYFMAKRQMQDLLDNKLCDLQSRRTTMLKENNYTGATIVLIELDLIEKLRNHVRNGMLWNTDDGK